MQFRVYANEHFSELMQEMSKSMFRVHWVHHQRHHLCQVLQWVLALQWPVLFQLSWNHLPTDQRVSQMQSLLLHLQFLGDLLHEMPATPLFITKHLCPSVSRRPHRTERGVCGLQRSMSSLHWITPVLYKMQPYFWNSVFTSSKLCEVLSNWVFQ